jgi:hypothetical protein
MLTVAADTLYSTVRTRRLHSSYRLVRRLPPKETQVLEGCGWTEAHINLEGNGVRREGGCLQSHVHASDCAGRRRDSSARCPVSIRRRRFRGKGPFMLKCPCRLTAVVIGRSRVDHRPRRGSRRRPSGARVSRQSRQDRASQVHPSQRSLSCGERASQLDPSRRGPNQEDRASRFDPNQENRRRAGRFDPNFPTK